MTHKKFLWLFIGLTVLALSLAACGVSTSGEAGFPTGKFIKSGNTDYGLAFNKDGTFSVFSGPTTLVNGTYKVEGDVFTETSNDTDCATNVSFKYSFDGKNLTISYAGDPADDMLCDGRYADFNNVTYTLAN